MKYSFVGRDSNKERKNYTSCKYLKPIFVISSFHFLRSKFSLSAKNKIHIFLTHASFFTVISPSVLLNVSLFIARWFLVNIERKRQSVLIKNLKASICTLLWPKDFHTFVHQIPYTWKRSPIISFHLGFISLHGKSCLKVY